MSDQVRTFHWYIFCHSHALPDPISTANITTHLRDDDDLSSGLVLGSSKKLSNVSLLNDDVGMLSSADSPTPAGRAVSFVSLSGSKVQVEFEIVCRRLRRLVLEAVTRERHGDDGVRILRLLLNTGKMDEKQVSIHLCLAKQFLICCSYNRFRKSLWCLQKMCGLYYQPCLQNPWLASKRCQKAPIAIPRGHSICGQYEH